MCKYCQREEYYQIDYRNDCVNVLDSSLKVVKVLSWKEFIKRIDNLK